MTQLVCADAPDSASAIFDAEGQRWTSYGELRDGLERQRRIFASDGKALVAIWSFGKIADVLAYLGVVESGQAVVMIDPEWPLEWQRRILDSYRPDWLACDAPLPDDVTAGYVRSDVPNMWRRGEAAGPALHADCALLLSTSGSTGSPKQVVLSQTNLSANAFSIATALAIQPDDRAICTLPIHYSYGLSVLNSHLAAGASVVLNSCSLLQREFWDLASSTKPTSLSGVPVTYSMLKRVQARLEGSSIRTLTQAGGRMASADVMFWFEATKKFGGRLFVMYGQTEATARIAILDPADLPNHAGSVGRAIPGGQLGIDATTGEVIYTGPNVMMGYATGRDDLSKGDQQHGVLRTGDLGRLDAEGFLTLTGRLRRLVKIDGRRVSLDELEMMAPDGRPMAAVAIDDRVGFLYEGPVDEPFESSVRGRIAPVLKVRPSDIAMRSVAALPRLPTGKIDFAGLNAVWNSYEN